MNNFAYRGALGLLAVLVGGIAVTCTRDLAHAGSADNAEVPRSTALRSRAGHAAEPLEVDLRPFLAKSDERGPAPTDREPLGFCSTARDEPSRAPYLPAPTGLERRADYAPPVQLKTLTEHLPLSEVEEQRLKDHGLVVLDRMHYASSEMALRDVERLNLPYFFSVDTGLRALGNRVARYRAAQGVGARSERPLLFQVGAADETAEAFLERQLRWLDQTRDATPWVNAPQYWEHEGWRAAIFASEPRPRGGLPRYMQNAPYAQMRTNSRIAAALALESSLSTPEMREPVVEERNERQLVHHSWASFADRAAPAGGRHHVELQPAAWRAMSESAQQIGWLSGAQIFAELESVARATLAGVEPTSAQLVWLARHHDSGVRCLKANPRYMSDAELARAYAEISRYVESHGCIEGMGMEWASRDPFEVVGAAGWMRELLEGEDDTQGGGLKRTQELCTPVDRGQAQACIGSEGVSLAVVDVGTRAKPSYAVGPVSYAYEVHGSPRPERVSRWQDPPLAAWRALLAPPNLAPPLGLLVSLTSESLSMPPLPDGNAERTCYVLSTQGTQLDVQVGVRDANNDALGPATLMHVGPVAQSICFVVPQTYLANDYDDGAPHLRIEIDDLSAIDRPGERFVADLRPRSGQWRIGLDGTLVAPYIAPRVEEVVAKWAYGVATEWGLLTTRLAK